MFTRKCSITCCSELQPKPWIYIKMLNKNLYILFESYIFEYIHSLDSLSCAPFAQLQPEQKRCVDTIAIGDYHKNFDTIVVGDGDYAVLG